MTQLLNQRQLAILRILSKRAERVTGEKLSEELNVSSRTIRNDIKKINEYSERLGAFIDSIVGRGYELHIQNIEVFSEHIKQEKVYTSLTEVDLESRLNIVLSIVLKNSLTLTKTTLNDLINMLHVSESTLRNDLSQISSRYCDQGVSISKTRNNTYQFVGEESLVRSNLINILYRHQDRYSQFNQNYLIDIIPEQVLSPIKYIVKNVLDNYQKTLSGEGYGIFVLHLSVGVLRNKPLGDTRKLIETQSLKIVKEILTQIDHKFDSHLLDDINFYKPFLLSLNRSIDINTDPELYEQLEQVVLKGISSIKAKTDIDFSSDFVLINGLILHLSSVMERVSLNLTFYNQTVETIKLNYPIAFEIALLFSLTMNAELGIQADDNELGLIAIHFGGSLERINKSESRTKKAIIVCGYGLATAMLIQERVKSEFGHQIEIEAVLTYSDYLNYDTSGLDFIFTTIPINEGEVDKMIFVDLAMSSSRIHEIEKAIKQYEVEKDLKDFFYPELYFKNMSFNTKEEAITFLAGQMIDKGFMHKDALGDIFARENMSSTEIGYSIAIPHYLNVHNDVCSIGVLSLKKPIIWKKEKVELILLMSLSPNKRYSWERVFRTIYPKITNKGWVKRVVSEFNFDEFIQSIIDIS